jgi:hypothetical protein
VTEPAQPDTPKHAFEAALDEAQLDPDGLGPLLEDPFLTGPAVGSFGDIAVASGYVATASLARAYAAEGAAAEAEDRTSDRPAEAARKLKAAIAERELTPGDLKRLRRGFAAQNHPDRVAPEERTEAVAAMAEINAEIDRALKRAKPG